MPEKQDLIDTEFEDAFNEATKTKDIKDPIKDDEPVAVVAKEGDDELIKTDPITDPVEDTVKDPVIEPDPTTIDWEELFNKSEEDRKALEHKMSSWEGRIRKANDKAAEAEAKLEAALVAKPTVDVPATTNEEDDTVLKEFKEEFPELVKPLEIMARQFAADTVNQSIEKVTPQIEAIKDTQAKSANDLFFAPIYAAHPAWKQVYDSGELQEWIETQPALEARIYSEITSNGTQEEIIGMFDKYYGKSTPTKPKPKADAVDPNVQKLVAVRAAPTGIPAGKVDKSDFDSAWKDAMASG